MTEDYQKNWQIFPGFELELIAGGLNLPVNISFVPNPKNEPKSPWFYVTELYGQIKVVTLDKNVYTYAEGLLNFKPDFKFPGSGENGVIGICVEPPRLRSGQAGDVIASLVYDEKGEMKNKVIRLRSKDGLKADSQDVIIDNIPSVHAAHQVQAVSIGFDGKLYVNIGDGMGDPNVAQDNSDMRGKILRMNLDGTIPEDNPNPQSFVFAKGFRNPFGATWRDSDKSLYVTDNGPSNDDRIAKVTAGENYGWPESLREKAIFWWEYTQAPTALDFCENEFGGKFRNQLFVNLFGGAFIKGRSVKGKKMVKIELNKDNSGVVSYDEFATYIGDGAASPCGLAFSKDGLYFTDLFGENGKGNVYKIGLKK